MSHPPEYYQDPDLRGLVVYGPDANCTLATCDPRYGVYQYRPSVVTNVIFLVFFAIALVIHFALGFRYKTWFYSIAIVLGCVAEVLGYGGRILLWQNPFSFQGFLLQIICITIGPTFYTAAIYVTLVLYLGREYARFSPKLYYWVFIPCDIFSLVLQSVGGALSSQSSGNSGAAVDVSIAGLSFQVVVLVVFIGLAVDYAIRYLKGRKRDAEKRVLSTTFKVFIAFLSLAIALILVRCSYRIDELREGYSGSLIHNEPLFVGLEGVIILISVYVLMVSNPGPAFGQAQRETGLENALGEPKV